MRCGCTPDREVRGRPEKASVPHCETLGLMRPISPRAPDSANQRAPSGPRVIPSGELIARGRANSVMFPPVVMHLMLFPTRSVNQRTPSGPLVVAGHDVGDRPVGLR